MNKDKIMRWLAEQVYFYDFNNRPFKYFNPKDFDIDAEEWKETMLEVENHYAKLNEYLGVEE